MTCSMCVNATHATVDTMPPWYVAIMASGRDVNANSCPMHRRKSKGNCARSNLQI